MSDNVLMDTLLSRRSLKPKYLTTPAPTLEVLAHAARAALREQANEAMADTIRGLAADTLDKVLYELSCQMKNCYSRSDA